MQTNHEEDGLYPILSYPILCDALHGNTHRAIEALKQAEEDEERRWRTQRHAHPTSPGALCAPDVSLVHLMVSKRGRVSLLCRRARALLV